MLANYFVHFFVVWYPVFSNYLIKCGTSENNSCLRIFKNVIYGRCQQSICEITLYITCDI